jgi:hypothetical protein
MKKEVSSIKTGQDEARIKIKDLINEREESINIV